MKKIKLFAVVSTILAMGLVACHGPKSSSKPDATTTPSSEPAPSTSTPAPSTSTPAPSTSGGGQSTSAPAEEGQMAVNAIDVITESNKVYLKISGTISGFANADAMKMAFGLLDAIPAQGATAEWLLGSETPADADYKLAPTVNNGAFELKIDVATITNVKAGVFTIYVGPKGAYAAVPSSGITMGSGKAILDGYRWYIRGDKGALAMDELPPLGLSESSV